MASQKVNVRFTRNSILGILAIASDNLGLSAKASEPATARLMLQKKQKARRKQLYGK